MMTRLRQPLTAAALATALLVGGCGGNEVLQPTVSVSVGQQLIDLKKARDSGALNERDYERQKQSLIDSVQ
ncbi:MAG: SHOCT domain-containing protein [Burkholderiales bacterium]